jgi:hypothetical protein
MPDGDGVMFAADALPPVPGLESYWQARTFRGGEAPGAMQERALLDTLGLGLEQALRYLMEMRPTFDAFRAWIVATAGQPDPVRLARHVAEVSGAPQPRPVRDWLATIDAAPPVLGPDELAGWDEQGFVVLRNAITRAEADAAAGLLWELVGARPDAPESWHEPVRQGLWVSVFQHPALEPARRSARVHKGFAQLWGTADLHMTVDRMSFNPPVTPAHGFGGSSLHWDVSLVRPIPFATQAILYLTDTAADQGALQVVPGFHRRIDAWLDALGGAHPRSVDLSEQAVAVPAGAGDLVIWRQELPHGASPNTSDRPRLAQYINMYPGWLRPNPVWL